MKRLTLPLLFLISPAVQANWTLDGFPAFSEPAGGVLTSSATLPKGQRTLELHHNNQCWQPAGDIRLNVMISLRPCENQAPVNWRQFRAGDYQVRIDTRSGTPTLQLSLKPREKAAAVASQTCPCWDGTALSVEVA